VHLPGSQPAARTLERQLGSLPGVAWAAVTAPVGRVAVEYDESVVSVAALTDVVIEVERATGLDAQPFRTGDHPGDHEPLGREARLLAGNLVGLGLAVAGQAARLPRLPLIVPTLSTVADATPQVRSAIERRLGPTLTDGVIGWTGALTQALAQRPLGLAVDAAHRFSMLTAAQARRGAWARVAAALPASAAAHQADPLAPPVRPAPLPPGPIERYAARVAPTAAAAYAVTLAASRNPQRALAVLVAAVPQGARRAREAFAAQLQRTCAGAGMAVVDPAALRRLDRVDTVVLDASALLTGQQLIEHIVPVSGAVSLGDLHGHAYGLVNLDRPEERQQQGRWAVEPLGHVPASAPAAVREIAQAPGRRGVRVLALRRDGELVGLVTVAAEIDPMAEALVEAARAVGAVVVAGDRGRLAGRLGVDWVVPGGSLLLASVRELQAAGRGVALVAGGSSAALAAADISAGVIGPAGSVPWGAHVLCPQGLGDAHLLIAAIPVARQVSRRGVQVMAASSAAAVLLGTLGPGASAPRRAALPVVASVAIGLATGTWHGLSLANRPPPMPADRTPWHAMPADAALRLLRSSEFGLNEDDAARRQAGASQSAEPSGDGVAKAAAEELASPVTATLALSAGVSATVGSVTDAALILGVLGANAFIGGMQRMRTNQALHDLMRSTVTRVHLWRAERQLDVTAQELVPGDVIELSAGDTVPADCRIIEASAVEADESALTGESLPVAKSPAPTNAAAIADRNSMLYEGTAIAAGDVRALVVATGAMTEIGRTVRVGAGIRRLNGVEARLRSLVKITLPVSVGAGLFLLAETIRRGQSFAQAIGPAVNLTIAAVPEGLPFVATVAELAAARRLSRRGALVRRPATLEALGRVDVLCFDKTGTLTEGRITLGYVANGTVGAQADQLTPDLRRVLAAALRASPAPNGGQAVPHPTDRAVIDGAARLGTQPADGVGQWERIHELPFEPGRGYHATLGRHPDNPDNPDTGDSGLISVKGAPEEVLDRCATWQPAGGERPLDPAGREQLHNEVMRLARKGFRILAVAERTAGADQTELADEAIRDMRFVGLVGLADHIRPTAADAAASLRQAGVEIVMVTGDHPGTAEAIAAELGTLDHREIVTGPQVDELDDDALAALAPQVSVFARVTPAQKARIVAALRAAGRTVAVTGDGANDAPAIRLADVGVALGAHATPAARESADLVVTDDRIETIVDAILEGRAMWASVRDALAVLLGGNLGEIAFTLSTAMVAGRSMLGTRQLLLVNLLTDALPAMAIAVRPPPGLTREVLAAEGPEASLGQPLSRGIAVRAGTTAAAATAAWLLARMTGTHGHAPTVALVALISTQLGQTLVAGRPGPLVLGSVVASMALLVAIVQTPGVSHFFGCRPLATGWVLALGCATAATLAANLLTRVTQAAA
jgi:cation-transporting ATPase I